MVVSPAETIVKPSASQVILEDMGITGQYRTTAKYTDKRETCPNFWDHLYWHGWISTNLCNE